MRSASDGFISEVTNGRGITKADVTLRGGTTLHFTPTDMMQGQLSVTSSSSSTSSFDIGSVTMGQCTFTVHNEDRRYSDYIFDNATVVPSLGALVGSEYEWHQLGVYRVEPIDQYGETLTLTCVDNMYKFERLYNRVTTLYPATLKTIVADTCEVCGVELATENFPNCDYVVTSRAVIDKKATCLEVIQWATQAAGCFANIDHLGRLQLRWYDTNAFEEPSDLDGGGFHYEVDDADGGGFHYETDENSYHGGGFIPPEGATNIKNLKASINEHAVTGLSVTEKTNSKTDNGYGEQILSGQDGYVLHVEDNPFIGKGRGEEASANVWRLVQHMELRDVSVDMAGTPMVEAGDPITVTDRHDITYQFWATDVKWSSTGALNLSCGVKSTSPYEKVDRSTQKAAWQDAIDELWEAIDGMEFEGLDALSTELSTLKERIDQLDGGEGGEGGEGGGTGAGWTFQVNGVTKTKGTVNFVTSGGS